MAYQRGISVDFGRDVLWLWKQAGAQRAPNLRVESETVSGRVIPESPTVYGISHRFETAAIIPCFTPNWNTAVPVARIDSAKFFPSFPNTPPAKGATLDYALVRGSSEAVSADAVSHTITHNLNDATAVVLVAVSWNTTIARGTKLANSFTVSFSVGAPSDGSGLIYWSPQSDDTDIYEDSEAVDGDATELTIIHNAGVRNLPMFFLPNWNTTYWFVDRGDNETTIRFGNSAPSGGGEIDWRIKEVTVS